MSEPNYMTPTGLARIQRELDWLQKVERPKIVAEVTYAASLGDRSENAEYHYGKRRLREIDRRLHFLIQRLDNIQVVDPVTLSGDKVLFGATIVISEPDGATRTWRIFGEDEGNIELGVLSWRSPLARALLGRKPGDLVHYQAPGGLREVEIITISYDPALPLEESPISPLGR